jgi:hypothetical protein
MYMHVLIHICIVIRTYIHNHILLQRADVREKIRCDVVERRQTCAVGDKETHKTEESIHEHEVEGSLEHEYDSEEEGEVEIEWEYE